MGFFSFVQKHRGGGFSSKNTASVTLMSKTNQSSNHRMEMDLSTTAQHNSNHAPPLPQSVLHKVITAALWSYFAGDALSAPTHWFYGGFRQIQQYYGRSGIVDYTSPVYQLSGSILNKSNLSGGGRSGSTSASTTETTIIGHVINHGKQDLWDPSKSIHYHATLQAGENTLEVQLARVLMKSIVASRGQFDAHHFRNAYLSFMTTPDSHNDTYASTCHRMFFANWYYRKLDPIDCPDNDKHNVDTIDGLVLPTITALAVAGHKDGTVELASEHAANTVAVTRNSRILQQYARAWGAFVFRTVRAAAEQQPPAVSVQSVSSKTTAFAKEMAQSLGLRVPQIRTENEITACYLDSAVPAMLDTLIKYTPGTDQTVWDALLVNANTGGENVHRGSCLGAIWGATAAATTAASPTATIEPKLINGLYQHDTLHEEIQDFLSALNDDTSSTT
jgi:ADP-ribosyl-[dinitrogen reductase] hydrolase